MQKRITSALCLTLLTACAPHYGNYANISGAYNATMADDTADELSRLYPPASTHLTLSQPTVDEFGMELVKQLRQMGYAVENSDAIANLFSSPAPKITESSDKKDWSKNHANAEPTSVSEIKPNESGSAQGASRPIGYIVDHLGENLYRVTISIDSRLLSRVYSSSGKGITPAGAWTRKE